MTPQDMGINSKYDKTESSVTRYECRAKSTTPAWFLLVLVVVLFDGTGRVEI